MWARLLVALSVCVAAAVAADDDVEVTVKDKRPVYTPPAEPTGDVYFAESFSDPTAFQERWVKSTAKKDGADEDIAMYNGKWELQEPETDGALSGDVGLVMTEAAQHYAIAAKLDRTFVFNETPMVFVAQYEVNFQDGMTCGGAYMKLLADTEDMSLENFHDRTPYSIMFGPDKCGLTSKVHFIVRYKNPTTGEIEEKHSKQSTEKMDFFDDKKTHLFSLVIRPDNNYLILVDQAVFLQGNLLEDLSPPIVPEGEIDDPEDKKPEGWDEREKIPDPDAVKPDDWDEDAPAKIPDPDASKPDGWLDDGPEYVPDPDAVQPEDWDEEEDGDWEPPMIVNPVCEDVGCGEWTPPMIANPAYKGKWKPPLIDNPEFNGIWAPRKIPNPAFFEEEAPFYRFLPVAAIGFELWTMSKQVYFDNIIITGEVAVANNYATAGWSLKLESERSLGGAMSLGPWIDSFVEIANEYPYLWALYAFAIVSPFVICAAFCVRTKGKPKDDAARKKKTDEPTPDDEKTAEDKEKEPDTLKAEAEGESFVASAEDEEKEEEGEEEEAEEETKEREKGAEEEEEEGVEEEGKGGEEGGGGSQGEEEEEEASPQEEEVPAAKPKSGGGRKRKTRRED